MSIFANEDEVYRYLGGVFESAVKDPELAPKLQAAALQLGLNYSDPEARVIVDFATLSVYTGREATLVEPNLEIEMTADDGHKFFLGKLNLPMAMAKKQIHMTGPVAKAMKFLPLVSPMKTTYEKLLRANGRDDLLS